MPEAEGQKFGKYLLIDRLAAGGMAEIYRAKFMAAAGVTKSVVIKRILPHYAGNNAFVSMFINEAKIAVGLAHGNIAQVFDFGEIDGEYYLAMEYVHGISVSKLMKKARSIGLHMPIPLAIYVIAEACAGLYYAHTRADETGKPLGIVHRDVSPQNIIVSFEGQVKLVDFGIAKARLASRNETEHGALKGKYVYFSPEQARSRPLDGRSDIFAAGICLYELLTGRLPFDGKMLDVLGKIARCEYDRPSLHNPRIAPELEQILVKALALRPEDRYQTALELNEALIQYLHTAWPRFSRNHLAHLAQYLAREELELDGVKVNLPEEFHTLLSEWKSRSGTHKSLSGAGTGKSRSSPAPRRLTTNERLLPPVPIEDEEESEPDEITDEVERPNLLQIARAFLVGPWRLAAAAGGVLIVAALLAWGGLALFAEPTPVKQAADETEPKPTTVVSDAAPSDGEPPPPVSAPDQPLEIDAKIGAVNVLASNAARIRLDPSRKYRVSVEGSALLRGEDGESLSLRSALYFAERARGTRADGSFGQLSPGEQVVLSGVRALYGFILDEFPQENSGSLKLNVTDLGAGTSAQLLVDPAVHVVRPDQLAVPRFEGLAPEKVYWMSLTGGADLGAGGGLVKSALYYRRKARGSKDRSQGVLTAETPVKVSEAGEVLLLIPDDDRMDNSGSVSARLEAAAE